MTIDEVIARAGARWPHAHGEAQLTPVVLTCENMARTEVLGLPPCEAAPAALAVPAPYDGLYEHYLVAMIAQMDGEYSRYNAEMSLFSTLWEGFAKMQRREHLPARGAEVTGGA